MSNGDFRVEVKALLELLAEGQAYSKSGVTRIARTTSFITVASGYFLGTLSVLILLDISYLNLQQSAIILASFLFLAAVNILAGYKYRKFSKPQYQKYLKLRERIEKELQNEFLNAPRPNKN